MNSNPKAVSTARESAVKNLAEYLNTKEFLYYINFADTLIRFNEITSGKTNLSWLRNKVLHYLIVRGGKLTPTRLAQETLRSKHSMTSVIDTLEKEGLVRRNVSHKENTKENDLPKKNSTSIDRRTTVIEVTPAGLTYVRKSIVRAKKWDSQVTGCLTPEENKIMVELSEKLRKKMASIIKDVLTE